MDIQPIHLKAGGSVMAHHRPSHAQLKAVFRATQANLKADKPEETIVDTIRILVDSWEVKGEDGNDLPLSKDGIDAAPNDVVVELSEKLQRIVTRDQTLSEALLDLADTYEGHALLPKLLDLAREAEEKPENVKGN